MRENTVGRRDLLRYTAAGAAGLVLGAAGGAVASGHFAGREALRPAAGSADISPSRRDRARLVARDIVGVDESGRDVRALHRELLAGAGPKRTDNPQDVAVVGAGAAGLAAAWILARAGHRVRVFEGSDRVGGRIRTLREPFAATGGHGEAGAMRIPATHTITTGVLARLSVPTRPFHMTHPHRLVSAGGVSMTRAEYTTDPAPIAGVFGAAAVHGRALLDQVLSRTGVNRDSDVEAWTDFLARYDEMSLRDWLLAQGLSESSIDHLGSIEGITARMGLSLTHNLMTATNLAPGTELVEIVGGTDRLIVELAGAAKTAGAEIITNSVVTGVDGRHPRLRLRYGAGEDTVEVDRIVVAAPYSLLRYLGFQPALSYGKQRAIAELHHDAATKTFLEFSTRWWSGHGGIDVTDAPPRLTVYPSHPTGDGGVVIASYTWADDAHAWDGLLPAERAAECLDHLADVHGPAVRSAWTGGYASHSWATDRWANGEAAIYLPGQSVEIGPDTRTPEMDGRVAFAGDATSTRGRAWIEGALESGARACTDLGITT
ncbi:NAD(P)/FAD-dependent oxidoreductase [Nocardia sp. XZ_19_369]|uniref:flavin monoamine oxidase family protein n=1 Tax=Nocardia sp. XZ_19_369 TaxID=2769487 RepID=UPI0027D1EFF8|nr:NAD(P)/FAD-dependent oxidoreductase [Nocardia sp. XZ_19_369]